MSCKSQVCTCHLFKSRRQPPAGESGQAPGVLEDPGDPGNALGQEMHRGPAFQGFLWG